MAGRIQVDARNLDRSEGCALVREALDLLGTGEILHLTLDRPPGCVHDATRMSVGRDGFDLKLVRRDGGTWKVRVLRTAEAHADAGPGAPVP